MLNRMLIIHESQLMRKLLANYALAELQGMSIDMASTSGQGLEHLRRKTYDVVLSATEMTPPDGFELHRIMRSEEPNKTTPFILMTSDTSEKQKQRMAREGIDYFLVSPYSAQEMAKVVEQALNPRAKRRHNRFGIPGTQALFWLEEASVQARVLNISLKGLLAEIDFQKDLVIPWQPMELDVVFPQEFELARARNISSVALRQEVVGRDEEYTPDTIRVALMFIHIPKDAEQILKGVMQRAEADYSQAILQMEEEG